MGDFFSGLNKAERESAVMSGTSTSLGQPSNKISLFGGQRDEFVDFTNPNNRGTNNEQQLRDTTAAMDRRKSRPVRTTIADRYAQVKLKALQTGASIKEAEARASNAVGNAIQPAATKVGAAARWVGRGVSGAVGETAQFAAEGMRQQATFSRE